VHRFPVPNPPEPFPTDAVPTCVASVGGHLIVADLAGRIWQVSDGNATILGDQNGDHYTGCAGDAAGNVYVVSIFKGLFPNPGTGSIVKVDASGAVTTLSGTDTLFFPNMIAIGPSGALYVSVGSVCTTVAQPNPCGGFTGGIVKITP
jgi:sugar lactone lactonase YvrE